MQATIIFLGAIFIFGATYFILAEIYRKQHFKEKLIVDCHKKRNTFLRNKVLQLFEIEKRNQHNLKVLEKEVEKLQQDIAVKHHNN